MLRPVNITPQTDDPQRHERIFLARYTRLRAWALQLTGDNDEAEDLVHDAFIQFTFTCPDLDSIQNLDGYLYRILRNLHLSHVRRRLRLPARSLSIVDYDSAETLLRAHDPREQFRVQDELRQVCRYACLRKESSKAGSVLLFRFMHGYYPREIAQVMRSSREAVEERLRVGRGEAKRYLENPSALLFMGEAPPAAPTGQAYYARSVDELLADLRRTIFESCRGQCLTVERLEELYGGDAAGAVDCATLAHIVSCPRCLDRVNARLGLPPLSERYPTDTLGTDTHSKGGDGPFSGGAAGGDGGVEAAMRRCRKRLRDTFEHRPQELCVAVNGYLMAAQRIGGERNEQTLSINIAEKIDFVEVVSEQEVRLLFLSVDEPPPAGDYQHTARVRLSDRRTLEATLSFSNPWPTLQVVYHDPLLSAEHPAVAEQSVSAEEAAATAEAAAAPSLAPLISADQSEALRERSTSERLSEKSAVSEKSAAGVERAKASESVGERGVGRAWASGLARVSSGAARLFGRLARSEFWLRPATLGAGLALVIVAALLFVRLHTTTADAAELLRRAIVAEERLAASPNEVLHRTLTLEERRADGGALLARRRIEMWQSAALKVSLRRLYDEQNNLIAGEWVDADGTRTVYRRGALPRNLPASETNVKTLLDAGELWRLTPAAKDFSALTGSGGGAGAVVEERLGAYVVKLAGASAGGAEGLLRASLTLSKADLHAYEQTLVLERAGEAREYRFIESNFVRQPPERVAPSVFQPEAELVGTSAALKTKGAPPEATDAPLSASSRTPDPREASAPAASDELEIEVTYLLNQIKANLGEQVELARTAGGALRVEALVETAGRKEEILRALKPILRNPSVIVDVSTVEERLKRERQAGGASASVREVEVADARIPADAEMRRYYAARFADAARVDEEIRRATERLMNYSRQALLRASALKRLVNRFSPAEAQKLTPEARARWLNMIHEHAGAYRRETEMLRKELSAIFLAGAAPAGATGDESANSATAAEAAERLLRLSYAHDETVRAALTLAAERRTGATLKSAQFWRSLAASERLALAVESAYQR